MWCSDNEAVNAPPLVAVAAGEETVVAFHSLFIHDSMELQRNAQCFRVLREPSQRLLSKTLLAGAWREVANVISNKDIIMMSCNRVKHF